MNIHKVAFSDIIDTDKIVIMKNNLYGKVLSKVDKRYPEYYTLLRISNNLPVSIRKINKVFHEILNEIDYIEFMSKSKFYICY